MRVRLLKKSQCTDKVLPGLREWQRFANVTTVIFSRHIQWNRGVSLPIFTRSTS